MEALSPKRKRILDFIARFISQKGYAPSIRDIVKGCGISSTSVAQYYLDVLQQQGYIRRDPEIPRSITLTYGRQRVTTVPVLGTIAAGQPIPVPTEETWHTIVHETVEVPAEMLPRGVQAYALRVQGDSMIDALVDDGDVVVLEATRTTEDGEMVAAWLTARQEATLKRLYREPGRIRLQPANRSVAPIYVDPDEVQVQGRVIAVLRKYSQDSPNK
jgi:repressor LexA